jgi:hypothetical protein
MPTCLRSLNCTGHIVPFPCLPIRAAHVGLCGVGGGEGLAAVPGTAACATTAYRTSHVLRQGLHTACECLFDATTQPAPLGCSSRSCPQAQGSLMPWQAGSLPANDGTVLRCCVDAGVTALRTADAESASPCTAAHYAISAHPSALPSWCIPVHASALPR